jgi:hypothetical protein
VHLKIHKTILKSSVSLRGFFIYIYLTKNNKVYKTSCGGKKNSKLFIPKLKKEISLSKGRNTKNSKKK